MPTETVEPPGSPIGYTAQLSVAPTETLGVSLSATSDLEVDVVEVLDRAGGDEHVRPAPEFGSFRVDAAARRTVVGSCLVADLPAGIWPGAAGTLMTWLRPGADRRRHDAGVISLIHDGGRLSVGLDRAGHLTVWQAADGEPAQRSLLRLDSVVRAAEWACVVCSWSREADRIELFQLVQERGGVRLVAAAADHLGDAVSGTPRRLVGAALAADGPAARPSAIAGGLSGRLACPSAWRSAMRSGYDGSEHALRSPTRVNAGDLVVSFDLARGISTFHAVDVGPARLTGELPNLPTRGVTGPSWDGESADFRSDLRGFDAVHFHEDDLGDAGWPEAVTLEVPAAARSGIYAVRARGETGVDLVPFVVAAPRGRPTAPVALVVPAMTYLAYANRAYTQPDEGVLEGMASAIGRTLPWGTVESILRGSDAYGLSLYDRHVDGSPVVYASCRRPLLDFRVEHVNFLTGEPRHLSADVGLLAWLRRRGAAVDVLSDFDVHARGAHALDGYRTVITGSHPEYVSKLIYDAVERHVAAGGHLMYLGGNGLYWAVGHDAERPDLIEVRKGSVVTPLSAANQPAEEIMSTTLERGGLWRHRGRPSERLLGVGTISSGLGAGVPYYRSSASYEPDCSWVFDGVASSPDGAVGRLPDGSGPAGDELDCTSTMLGTPRDAVVLATSSDSPPGQAVFEEKPDDGGTVLPGQAPRADMVLVRGERGAGDVFSVGSIAWANQLDHVDVDRITGNVLTRFTT